MRVGGFGSMDRRRDRAPAVKREAAKRCCEETGRRKFRPSRQIELRPLFLFINQKAPSLKQKAVKPLLVSLSVIENDLKQGTSVIVGFKGATTAGNQTFAIQHAVVVDGV